MGKKVERTREKVGFSLPNSVCRAVHDQLSCLFPAVAMLAAYQQQPGVIPRQQLISASTSTLMTRRAFAPFRQRNRPGGR